MKRVEYIDFAKGFAILLMLFDHTKTNTIISDWIFAFHMPIFFIIAGMLQYYRNADKISANDFVTIIKRRSMQLGIPYLVFCILLAGYFSVMSHVAGLGFDFAKRLFPIITLQGIESMWFIPCVFFAEIILCFTLVQGGKWLRLLLTFGTIAFVLVMTDCMPTIWWQRIIVKFAVCYSFAHIGYVLARYRVVEWPVWTAFSVLCLFSYIAIENGHVGIGGLVFQNGLLFYLNALMLSLAVLSLFKESEKISYPVWKRWSFFGKSTIVILCTNNIFLEIVRLIDYKLAGNFCLTHGLLGNIVCFVLLLLFEIPMIKLSQDRFALVFGKRF